METTTSFANSTDVNSDEQPRSIGVMNMVILVAYSIICVIGVLGNSLVLYIMTKMTKTMSVTDLYVTNLAIADVLLLIMLPVYSMDIAFEEWNFGGALCKIMSCMTYVSMYASIYFLALMSFDRWLAVVKAVKSRLLRNLRNARIACAGIWLIVALPFLIMPGLYREVITREGKQTCGWNFPDHLYYRIFVILRSVGGFAIPLLIITYCYIDIVRFMQKQRCRMRKTKSSPEQTKLIGMILIVIAFFLICWLPNQVTTVLHFAGFLTPDCDDGNSSDVSNQTSTASTTVILTTLSTEELTSANQTPESAEVSSFEDLSKKECISTRNKAFFLHVFTVCLGFSNSMLNPIIYSFMSARFRDKLFIIFRVKRRQQIENCTNVTSLRRTNHGVPLKYDLNDGKGRFGGGQKKPMEDYEKEGIFPDYHELEEEEEEEGFCEDEKQNGVLLVEENHACNGHVSTSII